MYAHYQMVIPKPPQLLHFMLHFISS